METETCSSRCSSFPCRLKPKSQCDTSSHAHHARCSSRYLSGYVFKFCPATTGSVVMEPFQNTGSKLHLKYEIEKSFHFKWDKSAWIWQPCSHSWSAHPCTQQCVEVPLEGQHYPTEHLRPSGFDNNKEACVKMSLFSLFIQLLPSLIVFRLVLSLALFHPHFISVSFFLSCSLSLTPAHTHTQTGTLY